MSINGVINGAIPNVKWPTLVLTEANSGKVDGEEFTKIDNQRWVGEFDYDQRKHINLGAIRNRKSGNYLAWDDNMNVVMNSTPYWWKVIYREDHVGYVSGRE